MNERFLSFLGLVRKANRMSCGHDAALASLLSGKAKMILVTEDASGRLVREFRRAAEGKEIDIRIIPCTMFDIAKAVGTKCGVFTINDAGFSARVAAFCDEDN